MSFLWKTFSKYFLGAKETTPTKSDDLPPKEIKAWVERNESTEFEPQEQPHVVPAKFYCGTDESDDETEHRSHRYFDEEYLNSIIDVRIESSSCSHLIMNGDNQEYCDFKKLVEAAGIADLDRKLIDEEKCEENPIILRADGCADDAADELTDNDSSFVSAQFEDVKDHLLENEGIAVEDGFSILPELSSDESSLDAPTLKVEPRSEDTGDEEMKDCPDSPPALPSMPFLDMYSDEKMPEVSVKLEETISTPVAEVETKDVTSLPIAGREMQNVSSLPKEDGPEIKQQAPSAPVVNIETEIAPEYQEVTPTRGGERYTLASPDSEKTTATPREEKGSQTTPLSEVMQGSPISVKSFESAVGTSVTLYKKVDTYFLMKANSTDSAGLNIPANQYIIGIPATVQQKEENFQVPNTTPKSNVKLPSKKLLDISLHSRLVYDSERQSAPKNTTNYSPSFGYPYRSPSYRRSYQNGGELGNLQSASPTSSPSASPRSKPKSPGHVYAIRPVNPKDKGAVAATKNKKFVILKTKAEPEQVRDISAVGKLTSCQNSLKSGAKAQKEKGEISRVMMYLSNSKQNANVTGGTTATKEQGGKKLPGASFLSNCKMGALGRHFAFSGSTAAREVTEDKKVANISGNSKSGVERMKAATASSSKSSRKRKCAVASKLEPCPKKKSCESMFDSEESTVAMTRLTKARNSRSLRERKRLMSYKN